MDENWNKELATIEQLVNDLLQHGPIVCAQVLRVAFVQMHVRGQQFALEAARENIFATLNIASHSKPSITIGE